MKDLKNVFLIKKYNVLLVFILLGLCKNTFGFQDDKIPNPVLPGVADAGVIRFNGEYYIGGVFTNGGVYRSSDLVNWKGPTHVFSMDNAWTFGPASADREIHANDFNYVNGVFHLYWSVNYWGKDQHAVHVGHATSKNILGPYVEPVKDSWFENRIDPALFIDDDGVPYFYLVKFTDGNTIWGRKMSDPWTFDGEPVYMFSSLQNTWETMDNRVAEGPWVLKYRDNYYMVYNTNHTATRWGNYMFGVSQANGPLGFHHGNKYPHPVMTSNQFDIEDKYVDLLRYNSNTSNDFKFTENKPAQGWQNNGSVSQNWKVGKLGLGSERTINSSTRNTRTSWDSGEVWVHKDFEHKTVQGNLALRIHHDGETTVFLNGREIYSQEQPDFIIVNLDSRAMGSLVEGQNLLAVHSKKGARSGFLDFSLFAMQEDRADDILFSPGQPNVLKGPNGFEWWMIYMANKNRERRGQYITRINFFDKKLNIQPISSSNTPGHHPLPSQPTFQDLFDYNEVSIFHNNWATVGGKWDLEGEAIRQSTVTDASAWIKSKKAKNYFFEANVKINDIAASEAGIYPWYRDEKNWVKFSLRPKQKLLALEAMMDGRSVLETVPVAKDFDFQAYNKLSVYKNDHEVQFLVNDLPTQMKYNHNGLGLEGIPGIFTSGAQVTFDGVVYTIGWDEYDHQIKGWVSESLSSNKTLEWKVDENGISSPYDKGNHVVVKGDALEAYELSAQMTFVEGHGKAGIMPVYINDKNYLKAGIDPKSQSIEIEGLVDGAVIQSIKIPLEKEQSYFVDMSYSDFMEKQFNFDHATMIDAIRVNKLPVDQDEAPIEDILDRVNISYKKGNDWILLDAYQKVDSDHPGFSKISFTPVMAEGLRMVNKVPEDQNRYIYKIWVNELYRKSHHLKAEKQMDKIHFWVDGNEVMQMPIKYPSSKVGLYSENSRVIFNGITVFDKEKQ
ncbi:beta-xylosidase [Belliella baltica DSM 15883]|uniref:Beta-xylosidase n=1 Tax=Belliella baltica (strain DSM 15883 / CIP 108006 / LMG 21964 / BA134) TaxID=866536 RepID=I3Z981_BELBD|nr:family 43 glycosylhydrolase [Belliella baltica]AFL85799.1 beta-xylosidase [Belliella baltica DSM 15883]